MNDTITITVRAQHAEIFQGLAYVASLDQAKFKEDMNEYIIGSVRDSSGAPESPKRARVMTVDKEPTMYDFVIANCSCGRCYEALVRNDRIPWRKTSADPFFRNAFGCYKVMNTGCPCYKYEGTGYIYRSYAEEERIAKIAQTQRQRAQQDEKARLEALRTAAAVDKAKANTAKMRREENKQARADAKETAELEAIEVKEKRAELLSRLRQAVDHIIRGAKLHKGRKRCHQDDEYVDSWGDDYCYLDEGHVKVHYTLWVNGGWRGYQSRLKVTGCQHVARTHSWDMDESFTPTLDAVVVPGANVAEIFRSINLRSNRE